MIKTIKEEIKFMIKAAKKFDFVDTAIPTSLFIYFFVHLIKTKILPYNTLYHEYHHFLDEKTIIFFKYSTLLLASFSILLSELFFFAFFIRIHLALESKHPDPSVNQIIKNHFDKAIGTLVISTIFIGLIEYFS